jgi:hypothetical protein
MAAAVNRAAATRGVRDWTGLADETLLGEDAGGVPGEEIGPVGVVTGEEVTGAGAVGGVAGAGAVGGGVAGAGAVGGVAGAGGGVAGAGAVGGLAGGGDPEEAATTWIDSFMPKLEQWVGTPHT